MTVFDVSRSNNQAYQGLMDLRRLREIVFKSSGIGFVRVAAASLVYIALTPFVIERIGKDLYGLWSISGIISGALLLSDFGFQQSLTHFTAKHLGDDRMLRSLFNATFWCLMVTGVTCLAAVLALKDLLVEVLGIPPQYRVEASFVITSTAIGFSLRLISSPYQALIEGNQRVDYIQKTFLCWLIFNACATLIGLSIHPSIYSLGIVSILGNLLILVMFYCDVRRRYAYARLHPKLFSPSTLKTIFPYSAWIQLTAVLILLREPLLKALVTRRYGVDDLASFEIAYRLTTQCMSFVVTPILTALPVSSLLHNSPGDLHQIVKIYLKGVLLFLSAPAVLIYAFSGVAIQFWLGDGFEDAALLLPWIFSAHAVYYFAEPLYKCLQGTGRAGVGALIQAMFLALLVGMLLWMDISQDIRDITYALLASAILFNAGSILFYREHVYKRRSI